MNLIIISKYNNKESNIGNNVVIEQFLVLWLYEECYFKEYCEKSKKVKSIRIEYWTLKRDTRIDTCTNRLILSNFLNWSQTASP